MIRDVIPVDSYSTCHSHLLAKWHMRVQLLWTVSYIINSINHLFWIRQNSPYHM